MPISVGLSRCQGFVGTVFCTPWLSCMMHLGWGRRRDHEACAALSSHAVRDPQFLTGMRSLCANHIIHFVWMCLQPKQCMHMWKTSRLPLNRDHVWTRIEEDIHPLSHNQKNSGSEAATNYLPHWANVLKCFAVSVGIDLSADKLLRKVSRLFDPFTHKKKLFGQLSPERKKPQSPPTFVRDTCA